MFDDLLGTFTGADPVFVYLVCLPFVIAIAAFAVDALRRRRSAAGRAAGRRSGGGEHAFRGSGRPRPTHG